MKRVAEELLGGPISKGILEGTKDIISQQNRAMIGSPGLAVIFDGTSNHDTWMYVEKKLKVCRDIGIETFLFDLRNYTDQFQLLSLISKLNRNPEIHGICIDVSISKVSCHSL